MRVRVLSTDSSRSDFEAINARLNALEQGRQRELAIRVNPVVVNFARTPDIGHDSPGEPIPIGGKIFIPTDVNGRGARIHAQGVTFDPGLAASFRAQVSVWASRGNTPDVPLYLLIEHVSTTGVVTHIATGQHEKEIFAIDDGSRLLTPSVFSVQTVHLSTQLGHYRLRMHWDSDAAAARTGISNLVLQNIRMDVGIIEAVEGS